MSYYAPINPETGKQYQKRRQIGFSTQWYDDPVAAPSVSSTPAAGAVGNVDLAGGYNQAGTQMQEFLKQQSPQYQGPGANRFETGLASAERRISSLLDDPTSIQQTAAYKFRLGQGEQALQRQLAAKGMAGSGNRLMELTKYGQDMASQEYDTQAKRLQDLLSSYQGAWNQSQGTNVQEALGKYSTASQAHTARGQTLANLMGTASGAYTSARGQDIGLQAAAMREQQQMRPTVATGGFRTIF